jgi:D-glycero-alpha-D-manno-heptose-7-phosphate kinase
MIIARAPLRLSLAGGGTDLPAFSRRLGGMVLSVAIDKYVYILLNKPRADDRLRLKYSMVEEVDDASLIQHELVKPALAAHGIRFGLEVVSVADVPAGTGLGSSGAFLVALLRALAGMRGMEITPANLAVTACAIETTGAGRPSGKQDPFISAFGGIRALRIDREERTTVSEDLASTSTSRLLRHFSLFYTNLRRHSQPVLRAVGQGLDRQSDAELAAMLVGAERSMDAFLSGDLLAYAEGMREAWRTKRRLSSYTSNAWLDGVHEKAMNNGALAGKVVGAGGGGFFLFLTEGPECLETLRRSMTELGLREIPFCVDHSGATLLGSW